ncbi:MAG TPA: hypothetical protein P5293_06925 [Bacteroidales bacterium]|nr:hypothetical protein [Bacteroidales bacterium]
MRKRWWERKERRSCGMEWFVLLTIFLISLKVLGFIRWSWWWIFAPIWLPPLIGIIFFLICMGFIWLLDG